MQAMARVCAVLGGGGSGAFGRRSFAVTFALLLSCLLAWVAATPMYGSPDEQWHAIKAYAVVHADGGTRNAAGDREYRVPPEYIDRDVCYAFDSSRPASCQRLSSAGPDHLLTTKADGYPPFFYVLVGWPTLLTRGVAGLYLMRVAAALLVAFLLACAVQNVAELRHRAALVMGLALTLTPAVFFFGASVNPSGVAVAAALAAWTGGFVVLRRGATAGRAVTALARFGAPLCLFLLLRRDSLVWGALILASFVALTPRGRWRELASARPTRGWGVALAACALLQFATGGHGTADLVSQATGGNASNAWGALPSYFREVGGGVLGWLDSPVPALTYEVFIAGALALIALSIVLAPRRDAVVTAVLAVLVVVVPLAVGAVRFPYFQGRYMLPLTVGVVLLAGFGLSESVRLRSWARWLDLVHWVGRTGQFWGVGVAAALVAVGIGEVLAFAQTLRRFSAGSRAGWFFAHRTPWRPPVVGPTTLTTFYVAAVAATLAWFFVLASVGGRRSTTVGLPPEAAVLVGTVEREAG